ncbi:inverse autotransporter beta domain-containing protein [Salmonella enterica]|uniref:inverse autotransporter beta domain-containing protein n=1 Tax=Salmonella enterica TaxID=28901 RepID=UPI003D1FFEEB
MKYSISNHRGIFRLSIWGVFFIWVFTPLGLSFTLDVMACANISNANKSGGAWQGTRPYVLKHGENVSRLSKQYGLTVAELKRLNQFRVFSHGFSNLKTGDELDVPENPVIDRVKQKTVHDSRMNNATTDNSANLQVAGYALKAGNMLISPPDGQAAAEMVKGMLVGKANQTLQEWMSQLGTAQVQLGVDGDFSLKHSTVNVLHPWYDTMENMVFSQTGVHRTDARTLANLGVGYRHFSTDNMLGANVFLDYDLSRDHARAGFGGEYWRNFLKLSANAYVHLSGWKSSPDVEDYDERPANGWDVRAEGYFPSYPHLGAKVIYEQYYGDEVALFGKDNRQKDPHAITLGVSYTPVPLLTLTTDEKIGQNGQHDTEIKAELNYRIGEPLRQQLDTAAVTASRSLMGGRYELIDRNNEIVLEYRKQEVIRLHVPERVIGKGGQVIPLTLNVKSAHGLKDIIWDDAALLAAGGKITGTGTQWLLTLPTWKPSEINAWSVIAVAHDTKGNTSKPAEMQVVLTPPVVRTAIMTAEPERLLADGVSTSTVTLTLKDDQGNAVTGMDNQLALSGILTPDSALVHDGKNVAVVVQPVAVNPKLTPFKETSPGSYVAILTTGTEAGKYALSVDLGDRIQAQTSVVLEDTTADMTQSTLTSNRTTMMANGTDEAILTLSLKNKASDGSLQGITGEASRLAFFVADPSADSTKYTFTTPQEGNAGEYTTHFSGLLAAKQLSLGVKIHEKDTGMRVLMDLTTGTSVVVNGNSVVGETLTATPSCTAACGALTYQWQIETAPGSNNWSNIFGATDVTYRPARGDQKKRIRVQVTE